MLPDTITLPVDVANNGTPVNQVYDRFNPILGQTTYIRTGTHSPAARDMIDFYRTLNKRVGNSFGVIRTEQKVTRDFTVDAVDSTDVSQPAIIRVLTSFPAGLTAAQKKELRQVVIALLDNDTVMDDVHEGMV